MTETSFDVIIAGGGIMGSSTAFNLMKKDPNLKVAVIERDPAYTKASTTLSMVNARIQFSLKQNIEVSQYAFDILENFEPDMETNGIRPNISYMREGNLFIHDTVQKEAALKSMELQKSMGCDIEWWSTDQIKNNYPLYEPSEYAGGTFGAKDGHFDAYAVLMGYKSKSMSLGAKYIEDEVMEIITTSGQTTGIKLKSGGMLKSGIVLNCAGAWCTKLAETAGIKLPVNPVKRQIFAIDPKVKSETPLPLTILPSGLYFRTETGGMILVGKSMENDPIGFDFTWDQKRFLEDLWFEIAEFVPAYEEVKLLRGWAGLYAVNTLDGNAIVGEWPELKGFYLANGFSGHGLQQGPATGRYLAELITGTEHALDMSVFSPERILANKPILEGGLV